MQALSAFFSLAQVAGFLILFFADPPYSLGLGLLAVLCVLAAVPNALILWWHAGKHNKKLGIVAGICGILTAISLIAQMSGY